MFDDFGQIESTTSHDQNLADWASDSQSGTVTEFSNPHFHNDGSYGFDSYEHDTQGNQVDRTDGHQLDASGQRSLNDYDGVEQFPLIGGKLDQQGQNQFGGVNSTQQNLNQF